MNCSDVLITLGSLNDGIKIIKHQLSISTLSPETIELLNYHLSLTSVYQIALQNIFLNKNYLKMKNNAPMTDDSDILQMQIQDNELTLEIRASSENLLNKLSDNKYYGDLIKKCTQARRVINELITTESNFINACNKIGKVKKLLSSAIELYKVYLTNTSQTDGLMKSYFESSIKALNAYENVENCFLMKYKSAIQLANGLESMIEWLNGCLVSTSFANYFEDKLKIMALSADMLAKLIEKIQKANNDKHILLNQDQVKSLALAANELSKPFQRLPRYVLLVTEVQKCIEPINKLQIFKLKNDHQHNNKNEQDLFTLLDDHITLVERKTAEVNQLYTLCIYNENLVLNSRLLLKQLEEFVNKEDKSIREEFDNKEKKSSKFFKTSQKSPLTQKQIQQQIQLEKTAANSLLVFFNISLQKIEQPAADGILKINSLEATAENMRIIMRNDFAPINKYLNYHYISENKFKSMEDLSPLAKILSPFFKQFGPLDKKDKDVMLEEIKMQDELKRSREIYLPKMR